MKGEREKDSSDDDETEKKVPEGRRVERGWQRRKKKIHSIKSSTAAGGEEWETA